ncbi:MAG: DUF1877 family protein [Nostoc sp.]|uniref:DUF1877 family protein n=1 Tax=Nostoc sp. TaxID=1180 RepID=UPI002FEEE3BB
MPIINSDRYLNLDKHWQSLHFQYCVGFGISWLRQAGGEMEAGVEFCFPCLSEQYCLHFLFTGDFPYDSDNKGDTLLHRVFIGGSATPWEAIYGMVRYLTRSEVNEINEALNYIVRG